MGGHSGSKDTYLKPKVTSLSPWTVMALHVVHTSGVLHAPTHPQSQLILLKRAHYSGERSMYVCTDAYEVVTCKMCVHRRGETAQ